MNADDERQPAAFKIAKAAAEAADLVVDLEGLTDRVQMVVGLRIVPDEDAEVHPEGGVFSLSSLQQKEHLNLLMEITQHFAKQTDYPLEMMVLGMKQENEG